MSLLQENSRQATHPDAGNPNEMHVPWAMTKEFNQLLLS
jgi:hypothetical protein